MWLNLHLCKIIVDMKLEKETINILKPNLQASQRFMAEKSKQKLSLSWLNS